MYLFTDRMHHMFSSMKLTQSFPNQWNLNDLLERRKRKNASSSFSAISKPSAKWIIFERFATIKQEVNFMILTKSLKHVVREELEVVIKLREKM